jgi:hypothetical protein
MKYLTTLYTAGFSLGTIEAISTIPTTDIETIIKLLIQLGVGIATIINLLRKKRTK